MVSLTLQVLFSIVAVLPSLYATPLVEHHLHRLGVQAGHHPHGEHHDEEHHLDGHHPGGHHPEGHHQAHTRQHNETISFLPHTPSLWKKGLCDRLNRRSSSTYIVADGSIKRPSCQPVGAELDCKCGKVEDLPVGGYCALWDCQDESLAREYTLMGEWTCKQWC